LSIDATTLNGRWNDKLAAAVGVDSHNWMYPVAYNFISSETQDNWTWFMQQLKKVIGDPPLLAICSDACKGLENPVKNIFFKCRAKRILLSSYEKICDKV
jgi:hypothetical protein